jgi:NDP-mannose synthase
MKAIVLAGGKGTRLAPHTNVLPKPLIPIGDMPILEIMLRQLKTYGFTDVVLCVGYLSNLLEAYFGNGSKLGLAITYSHETEPMGTAGPLALVSGIDRTFFVMNGDLLSTIDFGAMLQFHRRHGRSATVGLADKTVKIDLGVIETASGDVISDYIEKPSYTYKVSMGIYVFEPSILAHIREAGRLDLPDLILRLVANREQPMGFESNCRWLDMGRIEDYAAAVETFEKDRAVYLPSEVANRVDNLENP